jgi:hypothetical protein
MIKKVNLLITCVIICILNFVNLESKSLKINGASRAQILVKSDFMEIYNEKVKKNPSNNNQ